MRSMIVMFRCCSENLFKAMADRMVSDGYAAAGYHYVNIDDCWFDETRDPVTSRLRPDPARFPNGMKVLADYVGSFLTLIAAMKCFFSSDLKILQIAIHSCKKQAEWSTEFIYFTFCIHFDLPNRYILLL